MSTTSYRHWLSVQCHVSSLWHAQQPEYNVDTSKRKEKNTHIYGNHCEQLVKGSRSRSRLHVIDQYLISNTRECIPQLTHVLENFYFEELICFFSSIGLFGDITAVKLHLTRTHCTEREIMHDLAVFSRALREKSLPSIHEQVERNVRKEHQANPSHEWYPFHFPNLGDLMTDFISYIKW